MYYELSTCTLYKLSRSHSPDLEGLFYDSTTGLPITFEIQVNQILIHFKENKDLNNPYLYFVFHHPFNTSEFVREIL